jgi:hypothetical protein
LAEHLGDTPKGVSAAITRTGSLIRGIDACNINLRGLRPFAETDLDGPTKPIPASRFMDPTRPLKFF